MPYQNNEYFVRLTSLDVTRLTNLLSDWCGYDKTCPYFHKRLQLLAVSELHDVAHEWDGSLSQVAAAPIVSRGHKPDGSFSLHYRPTV